MYNYDRSIFSNGRSFLSPDGLVIGHDLSGREMRIPSTALNGHMLILGKSGTGKSNLLYNIIRQIESLEKENIVLLDPHGTLLDDVVLHNEKKNLVYLNPGITILDQKPYAVSFNMISSGNADQEEIDRTTGWLRDMMANEDAFSHGSWGPRLEVIFRVLLSELIKQNSRVNLALLAKTVSDKQEMKKFLSSIKEDSVRKFLEGQYLDWKSWTQYISSTMNRLLPLLSSTSTRFLISGDHDSLDLYKEISNGDRLIALNVSKSHFSGEVVRIVSSLFLLKLWTSILNGFRTEQRKINTYVIIDEFQSIPAGIIENLLREGRKFGIKVILASQFIELNRTELNQAVFGNVRNFVAFNLSDSDAKRFSDLVPGERGQRRLENILKGQKLHHAVILAHTDEGIIGPASFTPKYSFLHINPEETARRKLESLKIYSSRLEEEPVEILEKSLHERIIDGLETTLAKEGIEFTRSVGIGGHVADGVFKFSGREYVVEVEVSDITRKSRILSKLKSYPGRHIILVCPEGQGGVVHDMIIDPVRYRTRAGLAMEFPIQEGKTEIYTRDVAASINRTLIVEYSDGNFKSFWNAGTRRFLIKHLLESPTFQRELDHGEFSEVKNYIFRLMVSSGTFALRKSDLENNSVIRKGIMSAFIRKNCDKGSNFVFLKDLFPTGRL